MCNGAVGLLLLPKKCHRPHAAAPLARCSACLLHGNATARIAVLDDLQGLGKATQQCSIYSASFNLGDGTVSCGPDDALAG